MRVASLYVLLVVCPAIAVGVVLFAGQRLEAPPAIGTHWTVEVPGTARCVPPGESRLLLRQSGGRVDVRFEDHPVALSARLDGGRLRAEGRGVRDPRCPDGRVALTARLVTGGNGEIGSMVGLLQPVGCDSCAPTPFHAVRLSRRRGDRAAARGVGYALRPLALPLRLNPGCARSVTT